MNLRILKKLSKRAAPLLLAMGEPREQFVVEGDDGYTSSAGHDRKHWERYQARFPSGLSGVRYETPRRGEHKIALRGPNSAWRGTVMVGWYCGYEIPEWEEDDAWTVLASHVRDEHTDIVEGEWSEAEGMPEFEFVRMRRMQNPSDILRLASEMIAEKRRGAA